MNNKIIIGLMMIIGLSGCTNELAQKNTAEKVVLQKESKLSAQYLRQLSIISGRLDGMNQAIIQGLSETLDTARLAREMAENSIAISEKNQRILEELKGGNSAAGDEDEGEGEDEEAAQEDDF
jgi:ABC-type Fe3+/spermidine/putrescine transport system ATPase subunit